MPPTLTRAELSHYPGRTATEQALAHHAEGLPSDRSRAKALPLGVGSRGARASLPELALPRVLDLRPFPGRDRTERVVAWLVAHTPRAESWSREAIWSLAERIAQRGQCIE
ncbi:MAG: hypothetical protein U0263_25125 [Polyangiaceae bacterium]